MKHLKSNVDDAPGEFRAPRSMSPEELGDILARLVWESFSDFIAESDAEITLTDLLAEGAHDVPEQQAAEEALIFFLWAHTRAAQLAFIGRVSDALVRRGLDAMHQAVFDDMASHGTPQSQLPIFEQRVGARYSEYAAAADLSDTRLGRVVARHLTRSEEVPDAAVQAVAERAIAAANPLRDFLGDVDLIEDEPPATS